MVNMNTTIQERNIALYIILTIITCGLFGIYWLIVLADDMNTVADDEFKTSGAMVFLLTLITCGIYGLYWAFKQGERIDKWNGVQGGSTGILYLILDLFGFGIIVYALMQNELNKKATVIEQ